MTEKFIEFLTIKQKFVFLRYDESLGYGGLYNYLKTITVFCLMMSILIQYHSLAEMEIAVWLSQSKKQTLSKNVSSRTVCGYRIGTGDR